MARYNSVNSTGSIAVGGTISAPYSGLLTTITSGSGSVTLPNPVLYTGSTQTFYNATVSAVTLATPSGVFTGPGTSGITTLTLPVGAIITLVSDGTNYIAQDWLGGPTVATSITASGTITANGAVTFNPANLTVSIQPSGSGTVTINPGTAGTMDNVAIGVTTATTGKFSTLTTTGNVGIGGTPSYPLDVQSATADVRFLSSTGTNLARLNISNTGGSFQYGIDNSTGANYGYGAYARVLWNDGAYPLVFTTSSTDRMRILSGGNVGIGIATPPSILSIKSATGGDGMIRLIPTVASSETSIGFYNDVNGTTNATRWVIGANSWGATNKLLIGYNTGPFVSIDTSGLVGIGTPNPSVSLDLASRTDAIALPKGTTAQRPTPATGYFRFNTTTSVIEYYNSTTWVSVGLADGSSYSSAAVNAQSIKNLTGTTTSGYYYITLSGTPRQVWCDMSGSTAWMLAMRCANNTNTFRYAASYWTDSSTLNEGSDPLTNIDIKNNYLWQSFTFTQLRLTGSQTTTSYSSNALVFTGFSTTLNTMFNAGNNIYDSNIALGRSAWLSWFNSVTGTATSVFDNQPNCNVDQINANYTYAGARVGIVFNNEGDCGSDDAAVGFGTYGYSNSGDGTGCGGTSWNPNNQYRGHGWLWIT
jgi:hypothetical protein